MPYSIIRAAYLPVLRAVRRTCHKDIETERRIVAAVRMSIAEMLNSNVPTQAIVQELSMTRKMLCQNIAQVAYNDKIDSYSVKLTEDMVPTDGAVVDIKTPGDLLEEQNISLYDIVGSHSRK